MKESSAGFSGVGKAINTVVEAISVLGVNTSYVFKQVGNEIGGIAAQLAALGQLDFKAVFNIGESMRADAEAARAEVDKLTADILDPNKGQQRDGFIPSEITDSLARQKTAAPRLAGSGQDPEVAKLAAQLREFERMNDRERELLNERNEFLQDAYQKDLISIAHYYAARKGAADEALAAEQANITKEIELLRGRKAKDANEQAQNEAKIKELIEKKVNLQEKAGIQAIKDIQDQAYAYEQLKRSIEDVSTALLEQQGKSGEAAARRFDEQNRSLRQKLEAELAEANRKPDPDGVTTVRGSRALNNLNALREIAIAQGKLNELQDDGARIQSDLAIATDRAQIAAKNGSITELESLRAVSDARAQTVVDLQVVADAYAQVAAQTGNPAIVQRAKELQVEVEKLASSADLVREKFEGVFESGFETFFDKLTSGTASVQDAFKAMVSSISADIAKIASHNIAQQLFGEKGPLSGVVDLTAQLFGGKSGTPTQSQGVADAVAKAAGVGADSFGTSTAAAAAATQISAMATSASAASAVIGTLTATTLPALSVAADGAAAALARIAASGTGSNASGLFGLFGGSKVGSSADYAEFDWLASAKGNVFDLGHLVPFANGGIPGIVNSPTVFPMRGGRTGLMGEAGPEAIMPLHRDKAGELAVKMIGNCGEALMLPITRDMAGKLSVRAPEGVMQKFASGGAFASGSLMPTMRSNAFGALGNAGRFTVPTFQADAATVAETHNHTNITVNVPAGTNRESADQIAARTAVAVARSNRRNN